MPSGRERWFAELLHAGLETRVLSEPDILTHVTPTILAGAMPRDVMVRVFDAALNAGTISPVSIVKTATPELMAEHVAPDIIWACIAAAAQRAGILETNGVRSGTESNAREFLRRGLDVGLSANVFTPKDVVRHVNASVLGNCLPEALTIDLLEVSLATGKLNPEMIVETLGVDAISKHAPTAVVWACFAGAAEELLTAPAPKPGKPEPGKPEPTKPEPAKPAEAKPAIVAKGLMARLGGPEPEDDAAVIVVELDDSPGHNPAAENDAFDDTLHMSASTAKLV